MASLGDLLVRIGLDAKQFHTGMDQVKGKLDEAQRNAGTFATAMSTLGSSSLQAGSTLTATLTAPIAGLGLAAITSAGSLEQTRIAYTNLLGGAQQANELLVKMQQFAATTPFQFEDLTKAGQKLMAMGFAGNEILPVMKAVGDAVAGIGGGALEIDRVVLALGQMKAKGAVSGEEMKQLAELGIPVWQMLADAIGVSVPQAMKLVEQKAIESQDAIPVILAGMTEKFNGMMEQQSQTLLGRWSTFKDNIQLSLTEIGNTLLPIAGKVLDFFSGLAENAKNAAEWFAGLPSPVQNTVLAIGGLLAVIGPLLLAFGGTASAIGSIMTVWPVLVAGFGGLASVVGAPALAIAGVTAALVALGIWIATNWQTIVDNFNTIWQGWATLFSAVWEGVKSSLETVWTGIATSASTIWTNIKEFLAPIFDPLAEIFSAIWSSINTVLSTAWNWVTTNVEAVWNGVVTFLTTVWNNVKTTAETVWNFIKEKVQGFIDTVLKIPGVKQILLMENETKSVSAHGKAVEDATKKLTENTAKKTESTTAIEKNSLARIDLGAKIKANKDALDAEKDAEKKAIEEKKRMIAEIAKYKRGLQELDIQQAIQKKMLQDMKKEIQDNADRIADLWLRMQDGKTTFVDVDSQVGELENALKNAKTAMDNMGLSFGSLDTIANQTMPKFSSGINAIETAAKEMSDQINKEKEAYQTLGLPDPATIEAKKTAIVAAYNTILTNPNATPAMIQKAHKAMIDELDKIEGKEQKFTTFTANVKNTLSQGVADFSKILFDPNSTDSFADRLSKGWEGLKTSFENAFITPITTAFNNFVTNTINAVLQPALNGIASTLSNITSNMINIGGSAAGSAAGSAGGSAAGSGAGGMLGGLASNALLGGLIAGGLSIVGSVIGASMMGGDLGHIEENTRAIKIGIVEDNGVIDILHALNHFNYYVLYPTLHDPEGTNYTLGLIADRIYWDITQVQEKSRDYLENIDRNISNLDSGATYNVTIQGNVIGTKDFINTLVEEIGKKLQLAGA